MKTKSILGIALGLFVISCGSKDQTQTDRVSGTYVREYSIKIIHTERGDTLGERKIRDTIFIRQKDQGYEISNHKWSLNVYDKSGWQNMEHAENRPLLRYQATFEIDDHSLNPIQTGFTPSLYVNPSNKTLSKSKDGSDAYEMIQ